MPGTLRADAPDDAAKEAAITRPPLAPVLLLDRLDAEHRAVVEATPAGLNDIRDIPATRAAMEAAMSGVPSLEGPVEDVVASGPGGSPNVAITLVRLEGSGPHPSCCGSTAADS